MGKSVLTPVPEACREMTPVVEEAPPKEAPLFPEPLEEDEEELWLLVVVVDEVDEVTMAVRTGRETICP